VFIHASWVSLLHHYGQVSAVPVSMLAQSALVLLMLETHTT
jgi:hypothetical protein